MAGFNGVVIRWILERHTARMRICMSLHQRSYCQCLTSWRCHTLDSLAGCSTFYV